MPRCVVCNRDDIPTAPGCPPGIVPCAHVTIKGEPCRDSFVEMYDTESKQTIWESGFAPEILEDPEPVELHPVMNEMLRADAEMLQAADAATDKGTGAGELVIGPQAGLESPAAKPIKKRKRKAASL